MRPNFKINVHRSDETLHLQLAGEFDGSSAYELLYALKRNCHGASRAFIHTSCLKQIYPFGRDVLQNNLCMLNGEHMPLVFTGTKADQLAPDGICIH